jgi:hypothetical protein
MPARVAVVVQRQVALMDLAITVATVALVLLLALLDLLLLVLAAAVAGRHKRVAPVLVALAAVVPDQTTTQRARLEQQTRVAVAAVAVTLRATGAQAAQVARVLLLCGLKHEFRCFVRVAAHG